MKELLKNPAAYFLVVAILIIVGIALIANNARITRQGALTADEQAAALAKEGKREQLITYNDGMLPLPDPLDRSNTAANLFVIGVSQITLREPVSMYSSSSGAVRGFRTAAIGANGVAWYVFDQEIAIEGPLNNALIFDKRTGATTKIFDQRISIARLSLLNSAKPRMLAIIATDKDTNKDKSIDAGDIQHLYLYSVNDGELHKIEGIESGVSRVIDLGSPDYFVVEAIIDSDKNGALERGGYDRIPEPARLYRVDLKTFAATPLIAETLTAELQALVDTVPPQPAEK